MDTFKKAYIPYKGYYSSPFARWQGSLQLTMPSAWGPIRPGDGFWRRRKSTDRDRLSLFRKHGCPEPLVRRP